MDAPDPVLAEARAVAHRILGAPVEVEHLLAGGRNSRIYRVLSLTGKYALKQYPSRQDDPRDRLATEVGALHLMERHRIDTVPRVVGMDRDRGYALLTWIEGTAVAGIADADIDAALAFLATIHALRDTPWAAEQPAAAEACLSGGEIERQVDARLDSLRSAASGEADLIDFLDASFTTARARWLARAVQDATAAGLDFEGQLPQEWQTLVPSDFGFHNSLRRADGSLAFVDFEYFGWDDPVKLTADILLHPGRSLALTQRQRLRSGATKLYSGDPRFAPRLAAYLPLFGLRWVLILLNEFIPERWRRRLLAGASEDWAAAKARQLSRAREFLAALPEKVEG